MPEFGHDGDGILAAQRELGLYLEGTYAVYVIAEEVDTVGVFRRETVDIDDAAPHGKLPGFIDVVGTLETKVQEDILQDGNIHRLALLQPERLVGEFLVADDQLAQGIGEGHDKERQHTAGELAQHLSAQDFVGGILLAVFHGSAEGTGEEEDALLAQHLHQVMVEVATLLLVVSHKDKGAVESLRPGSTQGGKEQGQHGAVQTVQGYPALLFIT